MNIRLPAKPYFISDISYNPSWPDHPWYVQRVGVVAEQGGLNFGQETINFETIEQACDYLKQTIERDFSEYERMIKEKEESSENS
jgi:hypothetical protein